MHQTINNAYPPVPRPPSDDGSDARVRSILDQLASRASCRAFDGSVIPPQTLEDIVKDGLEAPSSCNQQNWHFVIVTQADAKARAGDIAGGNPHFAECSALIYLCFQKGWTHGNFSIVQSVAGACYHMMLSAHLRGFRCIWNAGIGDHDALRELLALPPIFEVQGALAIGRPSAEAPDMKAPRRPAQQVFSFERFERQAETIYPVKPAQTYPFTTIKNDENPFAEWDPTKWTWEQLGDFRGYSVWAKSPLKGVYISRRQGDAQAVEHSLLPQLPPDACVIEVMPWGGTSTTALLSHLAGATLTVAELSPHNITFIRERLIAEGADLSAVRFVEMAGPLMPLEEKSQDLVVLPQILEHAPQAEALIAEVRRVIKPGGHIVLSVRNIASAYGAHWRDTESKAQIPNQGPFTPLAPGAVRQLITPGFQIEETCGIGVEATTDATRLTGDAATKGRLYALRARRV